MKLQGLRAKVKSGMSLITVQAPSTLSEGSVLNGGVVDGVNKGLNLHLKLC